MVISSRKLTLAKWVSVSLSLFVSPLALSPLALAGPLWLNDHKLPTHTADNRYIDNDDAGLSKTLEYNFSPEDRARLRKALSDYARNTDPDHSQMEQKRKAMHESINDRFNECNRDNDDTLDREETTLCLPQVARHFSLVDVDDNGVISLEELELAQAKSVERQKAAEAKIEADRIQEAEAEIKAKAKAKNNPLNKEVSSGKRRPS